MGWQQGTDGFPMIAGSAINEGAVIMALPSVNNTVVQAASAGHGVPLGFALATAASPGAPVAVQDNGIAKALCAGGGSVVSGDLVAAGSNGGVVRFIPSAASGMPPRYAVGIALSNALAGDRFPVFIDRNVSL